MRNTKPTRLGSAHQEGYALMIIMFLLALLTISLATVAPNVITNARREQEDEMIWRGKQYVRGIRLYYTKLHKFPTELDDLYKPKTGIRFMRQAYKDPMNTKDGSWRMIYVGPNGMLIGSLKDRSTNLAGQPAAGFGGAAGAAPNSSSSSMFGSSNGFGSASSFGANSSSSNSGFGSNNSAFGSNNNSTTPGPGGATPDPNNPNGQQSTADTPNALDPQSLQAGNLSDGAIIGGNIIGVGSKINKKSIQWYEKAKNYLQFEFVWDPSVDPLTGSRSTIQSNPGNPLGAFGNNASAPGNPNGVNSNPNPVQNPSQNPTQNSNQSNSPTDPTVPLQAPQ
jgi:hypothetical protein